VWRKQIEKKYLNKNDKGAHLSLWRVKRVHSFITWKFQISHFYVASNTTNFKLRFRTLVEFNIIDTKNFSYHFFETYKCQFRILKKRPPGSSGSICDFLEFCSFSVVFHPTSSMDGVLFVLAVLAWFFFVFLNKAWFYVKLLILGTS
jgi:hypothetical protein